MKQQGFSLFEIIAVMAILAIAAAVAAPSTGRMLTKINFRNEVNEVMAQLRWLKLQAITKGRPVQVTIEDNVFIVKIGQEEQKRQAIKIDPSTIISMEPNKIRFSPEGPATPVIITMEKEHRKQEVAIEPLSGQPYKIARGRKES